MLIGSENQPAPASGCGAASTAPLTHAGRAIDSGAFPDFITRELLEPEASQPNVMAQLRTLRAALRETNARVAQVEAALAQSLSSGAPHLPQQALGGDEDAA
ncbi:hypothetical protein [Sphingobium sp. HDIP04]|uniref:hypothetical protein n=1 Tax=Sphingobium sp. HDIP04 TaxID=428994 RepID=UPI0012697F58|nr:hypothetical protein [Sphingobium sp. HDIP04]